MKIVFVLAFLTASTSFAQVRLPRLVRDSMIFQRDAKINIWGWAGSGEKVNIRFNGKRYKTTTGRDGKWSVQLAPTKAGGPFTMDISGSNKITLKEILVGDVWLCSGQSNMVHQMKLHNITYAKDIEEARYPQIRQFWLPTMAELSGPREDLPSGNWKWANPEDVKEFSVAAYFFAKTIYEKYRVPIGLINSSVGGPGAEAWTSEEGLKDFSEMTATIQKNKDTAYVNSTNRKAAANNKRPEPRDKGLLDAVRWYDPAYIPKGWRNINIPGYWEDQGVKDLDGIVWYRREITVPASMTGVPAKVFLGRFVDADQLYINGKLVGNTTYQYPQRRYPVPADLLKAGKNIFVIRVTNYSGKGGSVPDKPYSLIAGKDTIDLKGYWQYKVGDVFTAQRMERVISAQDQPTGLYNTMIAPLTNYNIKGILWYQGEGNTAKPEEYEKLLPALIADWRIQWKQPALPFLYVQLPNFGDVNFKPSDGQWARLRESQLKTLSVPNTAMTVTIDLGEWNELHPDNKKDIGLRLALAAQKLAYGEDIVYSGPIYHSSVIDGNKIIIRFNHTGSGLISIDGEELSQFAIAGADKKFVWASARIEGDKVVVWNEAVTEPMYVRYAWADNPDGCNLYNKEGLPASPFRTDK
jgi:sialate O-acetylesterase